jgi:hypothetical protein
LCRLTGLGTNTSLCASEEADVRINVPLLPVVVELEWRRLPPFRCSLRGLLLTVAVAALFFALCAYLGRVNQAIQFHNEHARKASATMGPFRTLTPTRPNPLEQWHYAMALHYHAVFERLDFIGFLIIVMIVSVTVLAVVGRILNWFVRQSSVSVDEEPSHC